MRQKLLYVNAMMTCIVLSASAQINVRGTRKLNPKDLKMSIEVSPNELLGMDLNSSFSKSVTTFNQAANKSALVPTIVGTSKYDLQTNGSVGNRTSRNSDGTGHVNFTWSSDITPWNTRGTAYVYYNGSSFSAAPSGRIENVRTGWGDYTVLPSGKEIVVSHAAADLRLTTRPTKGTGAWTTTILNANTDPGLIGVNYVWPRIASGGANGQTVHIICNSKGLQTTTTAPIVDGVKSWLAYFRSTDGGVTFTRKAMPTLDSLSYRGGVINGDTYSIDCKGDTVVVVVGNIGKDIQMAKSVDGGLTWAKTVIFQSEFIMDGLTVPVVNGDTVTIDGNDGAVNTLIDNTNKVHVFWSSMRVTDNDAASNTISLFLTTAQLNHWVEGQATGLGAGSAIAGIKDLNGDTTLNLKNIAAAGSILNIYGRIGNTGMLSHPYAAVDNANNIYVSYDALVEDTTYTDAGNFGSGANPRMLRNVFMIKGKVNPSNPNQWCFTNSDSALNLNDPFSAFASEAVFACLSRRNNTNNILVQWQEDAAAGISNGAAPLDVNNQNSLMDIKTDFIALNSFSSSSICEVLSIQNGKIKLESVLRLYPNPSNGNLTLKVGTTVKSIELEISNLLGQSILNLKPKMGTQLINLTQLNKGVYFANFKVDGVNYTEKIIIE